MAQDILVNYKSNVSDLTNQLKIVVERMDRLEAESKASAKGVDTLTKSVDKLDKELASTGKSTATATKNIKDFSKSAKTEIGGVGSVVGTIGASIATTLGAAFSVAAILQFSKVAVNAFLESEVNANKLKFAITVLGGESDAVFNKLIKQSQELQKITIFSDDSIQQAQAALRAFDLTGAQIEELIPKLADFATVSQQSIESAAQMIGQGLEGAGREFKKYGIEVSATASRQENFNKILAGFGKFAGAAENATNTLTGQLEQAKNRADELQESIGQKLAPSFVRARVAILEAAEGIVQAILNIDESVIKLFKTLGLAPAELAKASNSFELFSESILDQVNGAKTLAEFEEVALKLRNDQTLAISKQQAIVDKLQEAKEKAQAREIVNLEEVKSLNEAIALQQNTNLQNEISKLNIIEDILTKQSAVRKATSKSAVDDKRIPGIEKEIELIKSLGAQYSDLFELLDQPKKSQLLQLAVTAQIDNEADILAKIKILEGILEENKIEIPIAVDDKEAIQDTELRFNQLKQTLEDKDITVDISIDNNALETLRTEVAKLAVELKQEMTIPITLEVPDDRKNVKFNTGLEDVARTELEIWIEHNGEILNESVRLLNELNSLYDSFAEVQIQRIEEDLEAQLKVFDAKEDANEESLEKRRISEKEFLKAQKENEAARVQAEAAAAKKINDIKRRQFNLDKIAALAEIAIATAKNIASAENIALIAVYAALGAAQAGVVAAQPNPYRKGTKSAKAGLALVDEEGTEAILRGSGRLTTLERGDKVLTAPKTKTYGAALDAMMGNRWNTYVSNTYIAPQLEKQRKKNEAEKSKTFAQNITESIYINKASGRGDFFLEQMAKQGINIKNVDDFKDNTRISYKQR